MLDSKDIEIFLNLQNNPLAKISEIAENIGLSVSNTSARIEVLEKKKKVFTGVRADLNLDALELEFHDFLFKVKSRKSLEFLEKDFSFNHPYLYYRGRCNGPFPGVYMQFRTPTCGSNYVEELAGILKDKDIIDDYYYIPRNKNEKNVNIKSSIKSWDSKKQDWIFDWGKWIEGYEKSSDEKVPRDPIAEPILDQLTTLDIRLLSEIAVDARSKNVDLIKKLKIRNEPGVAQKVSRRVRFLKANAISDYRVFLNWTNFDLYQTILVRGYSRDGIALKLRNYLLQNSKSDFQTASQIKTTFPFQCQYHITNDGFYWYIRIPPIHQSDLLDFVWQISPDHQLFLLDYRFSEVYKLWDQTFDAENQKWKMNYDFMIKSVIDSMD